MARDRIFLIAKRLPVINRFKCPKSEVPHFQTNIDFSLQNRCFMSNYRSVYIY